MSDWTPLPSSTSGSKARRIDSVRMMPTGPIYISGDLALKFGEATHVEVLMNGSPSVIGFRAVPRNPGKANTLKLGLQSGHTRTVSGKNILAQTGRDVPERVTDLPHRWDGDVLVVDLSGLPDAPERL